MAKKIKVSLFDKDTPSNIVLTSNGKVILDDVCISATTEENRFNGSYIAELRFIVDDMGKWRNLEVENILKLNLDYGDDVFRIVKVVKDRKFINVTCLHITYDLTNMWLNDVRPTDCNGLAALNHIVTNSNEYKENKQYAKDIKVFSDIENKSTAYYQDIRVHDAIFGNDDNSFSSRWGDFETQRRSYNLNILKKVGVDRGFQIRSRRNLTGFEQTIDDNYITRLKPKGFNGITINGYVESPLINNYPKVKTQTIKYEDIKVRDENTTDDEEGMIFDTLEAAQQEMIKRASEEFSKNKIDIPKATYKISFVELDKTEEYKDYKLVERVYLGDIVHVYEEKLGIKISVRASRRRYDVLKGRTIDIELTNTDIASKPATVSDIKNELDKIPSSESILSEAKKQATAMIEAGMKNSYVVVRKNEILIMDNPDLNAAIKVWRWNNGGLGFSKTGYYGSYDTAITSDGAIVADFISTGILSTVLIKNADGSFEIDLSGTGGILFRAFGKRALEIKNNTINFYSSWDENLKVSSLFSDTIGFGDGSKASKTKFEMLDDGIFEVSSKSKSHIIVDPTKRITYGKDIALYGKVGIDDLVTTSIEDSPNSENKLFASSTGTKWVANKGFHINNDFSCSGNKNCVQKTESYGNRLFYSKESASSLLTFDELEEKEVVENNELLVPINEIYKESVRLDLGYRLIMDRVKGDYDEVIKTNDYFIIKATNGFKFTYSIEAKRQGFEKEFMNEYK